MAPTVDAQTAESASATTGADPPDADRTGAEVESASPVLDAEAPAAERVADPDAGHRHDSDHGDEGEDRAFGLAVGQRLRAIRQAQGLSLAGVEARSQGRWSASAVGAYERGFRTLSLPRLKSLADFYQVPVGVVLGEPHPASASSDRHKIVLDLVALNRIDPAAPIRRFVQSIIDARGDFNGKVLSLRHGDLKALCTLVGGDIPTGIAQLRSWEVMVQGPELAPDPIDAQR